jgi:hypothetical protein
MTSVTLAQAGSGMETLTVGVGWASRVSKPVLARPLAGMTRTVAWRGTISEVAPGAGALTGYASTVVGVPVGTR